MKIKSDTRYSDYSLDLQLLEAKSSTLYLSDAFKNMKFSTMGQYKQALNIKQATRSIIEDMSYVTENRQHYESSLTKNTYIAHNLKVISSNAQTIQQGPDKNLQDQLEYGKGQQGTQLSIGLAYLDRAGQSFINRYTPVKGYNEFKEVQKLQDQINIASKSIVQYNEDFMLKNLDTLAIVEKTIEIAVPRLLIFASTMYRKQQPIIQGAVNTVAEIFNILSEELMNMSQELFNWGDVKNNPLGQILNVMTGIQNITTAGYSIVGRTIGAIIGIFGKGIAEAIFSDEDSKDSIKSSIFGTLKTVFMTLGKLITGMMNLAIQGVQISITQFINIMSSIFSLVKNIFKTSPLFMQILNYIELAISLFFLPFFTMFGIPLLDAIMSLYSWVITEPIRLLNQFMDQTWTEEDITNYIDSCLDYIDSVLQGIDENKLYDSFKELANALRVFIAGFIETILDHSDEIKSFIDEGLEVFDELLDQDILGAFLDLGNSCLEFIEDNMEGILNVVHLMFSVARDGFEIFGIQISNFYLTMDVIFIGLGAIQGQLTMYRVGELVTLFTAGLGSITIPELALIGAGVGAGIGHTQWQMIEEAFLRKDWLTYYENFEIPDDDKISKFAKGGKVYKRNGGLYGIMAEAGEGEWAIPKSKTKLFRGNNNVIIRINGKTYNKSEIDSALNEIEPTLNLPFNAS